MNQQSIFSQCLYKRIFLIFTLLLVSLETRADDLVVPKAAKQWQFESEYLPHPITTDGRYSLWNNRSNKPIKYGQRDYGINLEWANKVIRDIRIERFVEDSKADAPPGTSRHVTFGELVAIYVEGGGYLVYQERKYGINLGWHKGADNEIYQWRLANGAIRDPVKTKRSVALFNIKAKDYLVYGERNYGINLRWHRDTR